MSEAIKTFLTSPAFAVAGASTNRDKFGNKVLRCYLQHQKTVYPINSHEEKIEGLLALKQVSDLPTNVHSLSIVTPPPVTEKIIAEAIQHGIKNIWMQPGAESSLAIEICKKNNINVIAGGPCILVELGCHNL
jgi:predicted CoA-binding protein